MGVIEFKLDLNPIYVFLKRHYCPKCNKKMSTSYTNQVLSEKNITSSSSDICDSTFSGDLEIRNYFFWCSHCDFKISLSDMKNYEKTKGK